MLYCVMQWSIFLDFVTQKTCILLYCCQFFRIAIILNMRIYGRLPSHVAKAIST